MIETPDWLVVALDEAAVGIVEVPGEQHDTRILRYHAGTTLGATEDEVPWCAAFVGFCIEQAGLSSTNSARARSYLEWGRELAPPAYGAVVVFSRGPEPPGPEVIEAPGHVGFLVASPTPHELLVLSGNQSNKVCIRAYARSRLLGVRWPD